MIDTRALKEFFDVGSLGPLFIFILGMYSLSLFAIKNYSLGVFVTIIAFIIYIGSNLFLRSNKKYNTYFNEYLDDMSCFLTFGITTIVFGLIYFETNPLFLAVIFFYAITAILSIARNSILNLKNTSGYPIVLNGIFFPLTYYFYLFYLDAMGSSIFLLFYIIVGLLLISDYNFLGSNEGSQREVFIDKRREKLELEEELLEEKKSEEESLNENKFEQISDVRKDTTPELNDIEENAQIQDQQAKEESKESDKEIYKIQRDYVQKEESKDKKTKIKNWINDIKGKFSKN